MLGSLLAYLVLSIPRDWEPWPHMPLGLATEVLSVCRQEDWRSQDEGRDPVVERDVVTSLHHLDSAPKWS